MDGRLRSIDAWCETCDDVRPNEVEDPGSCRCTTCGHVELLVVGTPAKGGASLNRASPSLGNPNAAPTTRRARQVAAALDLDAEGPKPPAATRPTGRKGR